MNFLKAFAIVAIAGGIVACSDENASAVWNSAELSSSDNATQSSSSSEIIAGSSSSVGEEQSSSSTENVAESSSSAIGGVESSSSTVIPDTVWHLANLTWYTSWPEPDSEECIEYNGCIWAGYFAGVEGQMTEEWVSQHNIIAVHEKDWNQYKLKTFRLRMNGSTIDAVVYDMCSDSDCDGCCTENAGEIGFLIDIEKYTRGRFDGNGDGVVEWTCLDCE
ncbi:hypothetical protein [uncultured Fibrobacter sp.]|uniref:hypothetical protein n=1 Tax=uncultured Fibrobacter sp. TaxID=261512 RepID=UPI0025F67F1A|nr:hypothetical protein [uncultured Fibrobacter sp.]